VSTTDGNDRTLKERPPSTFLQRSFDVVRFTWDS